jgi:hypothetical protein
VITITKRIAWRLYWGEKPLPMGAVPVGVVTQDARTGVLLQFATGAYALGSSGEWRPLPPTEVRAALAADKARFPV